MDGACLDAIYRQQHPDPPSVSATLGDLESWIGWLPLALRLLPEKQRIAVDFRYRWGMPYWAVAAAIETTDVGARVCVCRGLARLRTLAGERCAGTPDAVTE